MIHPGIIDIDYDGEWKIALMPTIVEMVEAKINQDIATLLHNGDNRGATQYVNCGKFICYKQDSMPTLRHKSSKRKTHRWIRGEPF